MASQDQSNLNYAQPTKAQRRALHHSRLLLSCITNSALIGFNQCLLLTLPMALFLPHFSMSTLPIIYTGMILINFIFHHIHQKFKRTVHSAQPLCFYNIIAAIIILGLWWDIHYADHHWIRAILLLVSVPFISLSSLQMLMINKSVHLKNLYHANYIMKLTQLAFIGIGGLLIPLLVLKFGVEDSLPILSLTLAISALLIGLSPKPKLNYSKTNLNKSTFHASSNLHTRYIVKLILYSGLGIFCFYCINFVFNSVVKIEFQHSINIAVFLGIFFAVVGFISLILHITLKRYLMNRLSVAVFIYIWPSIILLTCLLALLGIPYAEIVIPAVICLQLFEEILRNSALDDMQTLLKQPLARDDRHWLTDRARPTIRIIAGLGANISLLLFYHTFGFSMPELILIIMLAAIIMLYLTPGLKKLYIKNLLHVIGKHHLLSPKFRVIDQTSLSILNMGLKSSHSEVALYSLNILRKNNLKLFINALKKSLEHQDPHVRKQAISLIGENHLTQLINEVKYCLKNDPDLTVQGQSVIVVAQLEEANLLPIIQPYLESDNIELKIDSIIALLNHGDSKYALVGSQQLDRLANSPIGSERIAAANILNQVDSHSFHQLLKNLLQDDSIHVRKKAIDAVAHHPFHPDLIDLLINAIHYPQLRTSITQTLSHFKEASIPKLISILDEYENAPDLFNTIIQVLIQIKSPLITEKFYEYIDHPNPKIRHYILQALHQLHFRLPGNHKRDQITKLLKLESILCIEILESIHDLQGNKSTNFLIDLLKAQLKQQKESIIYLLSFYYPEKGVMKAWDNVQSCDTNLNTHGIGLFDHLLIPSHRTLIIPLLKQGSFDIILDQIPDHFRQEAKGFHERLQYIVEKITYLTPVIQACALYTATQLRLENIECILKAKLKHPNPIIRETVIWGLWFCQSTYFKTAVHDMLNDNNATVANTAKRLFSLNKA